MVSIIIPFYNSEHFLERAILSVIHQTYTNFEIILINDGSIDGSSEIARKYCNQYTNIRLFTTQNVGPGNARNIGIKHAIGEFITFLDSDDTITNDAIEILLNAIQKNQSDMVVCMFTLYDKEQTSFKKAGWRLKSQVIDGIEAIKNMYTGGIVYVVWAKLFRAEIIKKISFPINLWFEDRPFILECFLNTDKISFVKESLWKIYSREDSITRRTVTDKRLTDPHLIYEMEMNMLIKYNKDKELTAHVINHNIDVLLDTFFLLTIDNPLIKDIKSKRKLFINSVFEFNNHYVNFFHRIDPKRKVILHLLKGLKYLPWDWIVILTRVMLKKKYKGVKLLKNS